MPTVNEGTNQVGTGITSRPGRIFSQTIKIWYNRTERMFYERKDTMIQTVTAYVFPDGRMIVFHDPECGGDIAQYYLPEDHEQATTIKLEIEVGINDSVLNSKG